MGKRIKCLALMGYLLLACGVITFQQPAAAVYSAAAGQSADAKQAVLQKVCGTCHTLSKVTGSRRSRSQWEEVTDKMIAAGAKASDEEFATVINYLVSQFGRAKCEYGICQRDRRGDRIIGAGSRSHRQISKRQREV